MQSHIECSMIVSPKQCIVEGKEKWRDQIEWDQCLYCPLSLPFVSVNTFRSNQRLLDNGWAIFLWPAYLI